MVKKTEKLPERLISENFIKPSSHFEAVRQSVDIVWPLHWHEFYEMEFIISGKGIHIINGITYPLVRGSIYLLTPADFHEVIPDNGSVLDIINVKFSDKLLIWELREMLFTGKNPNVTIINEQKISDVETDFNRLLSEADNREIGSDFVIQGTLNRILIDLVRSNGKNHIMTSENTKTIKKSDIQKSLIYIQHHFREPLTLEMVARQSNLSVNYFCECFHNITGFSFKSYLTELRLQFALSLLDTSKLSVTEICYIAAFNSLSNFLRVFKKRFGVSPNVYRKNH